MLVERKGKVYLTRRSLLRAGVAALTVGGSRAWGLNLRGAVAPTTALATMLAGMAPNTWARVLNQGGQTTSDYLPHCYGNDTGAVDYNSQVVADNAGFQGTSCDSTFGEFQSVTLDTFGRQSLAYAGGGHGSGQGNEMYSFQWDTLKWSRKTTPDDSWQNFQATGSFGAWSGSGPPGPFPTLESVMTITAVKSITANGQTYTGYIAPGTLMTYDGGTNFYVYVVNQRTGTVGGIGTYTVAATSNSGATGSVNIASCPGVGTTVNMNYLPGVNYPQGAYISPNCPTNRWGAGAVHGYGMSRYLANYPDSKGLIYIAGLSLSSCPMTYLYMRDIPTSLPSPVNWLTSGSTSFGHGYPGSQFLTHAPACVDSLWRYGVNVDGFGAGKTNSVCVNIPSTTRTLLISQSGGSVYDFTNDTWYGSQPVSNSGDDSGHAQVRGTHLEAWLIGSGILPTPDFSFTGFRKYTLDSGVPPHCTQTDVAQNTITNPGGTLDLWIAQTDCPYVCYYAPKDKFVALATTQSNGGVITTRNTSAYASQNPTQPGTNPSPGNVFDIFDPTALTLKQFVSGYDSTLTAQGGLPADLTFQDHFRGQSDGKLVDLSQFGYAALGLITASSGYDTTGSVYIFKVPSGFAS